LEALPIYEAGSCFELTHAIGRYVSFLGDCRAGVERPNSAIQRVTGNKKQPASRWGEAI
jgi:hypothetical protein